MRVRLRAPGAVPVLAVLLVAFAFYTWTAATSDDLSPRGGQRDPYNLLADAFLAGRTSLDVPFDKRILTLRDPYDVGQRLPYPAPATLDLSLYDGKIYPYWGASPALVAFIPFRVLGLGDLPPGLAVLLFSLAGLVASVALLRAALARWLPRTPGWAHGVAAACLAAANVAPFVLRRPAAYEVAISGGFCFAWLGLLALWHGAGAPGRAPRTWLLTLASLAVGVAFASRPPLALAMGFFAVTFVVLDRERRLPRVRSALALFAPFAVCVALVGTYNAVRFDSPAQFGQRWQLAGQEQDKFLSASYLAPGLWYYVLNPPRPRAQFPYLWTNLVPDVPWGSPKAYDAPERTAGLVPSMPIVLLLLAAPLALRAGPRDLRRGVYALTGMGALLLLFVSLYYWGGIQRYEMDFATPLLLAALLVWLAALSRARGRRRRAVAIGGGALVAWSVVVGLALSVVGSDDRLRLRHPGTYASLTDFFSPIPSAMASVVGRPIVASVDGSPLQGPQRYDRLGVEGASFFVGLAPLPVEVVTSGQGPVVLRARVARGPTTPKNTGRLLVQAAGPDGAKVTAPVRGREVALALPLKRGVNRIALSVLARHSTGIADAAAEANGSIRVSGLRATDG